MNKRAIPFNICTPPPIKGLGILGGEGTTLRKILEGSYIHNPYWRLGIFPGEGGLLRKYSGGG